MDAFQLNEIKDDFYLTASRMVPYKKIDLIVEAFAKMPERRLVVIGDGPDMRKIRAKASPNVEIMGYQPFSVLHDRMRRAKAFVFAAEEDFGISVVEAQACGTPVIAYGKGGALETVRDASHAEPTGIFFDEQSIESIVDAVQEFELGAVAFRPPTVARTRSGFDRAFPRVAARMSGTSRRISMLPPMREDDIDDRKGEVKEAAQASDLRVLAVDQSGALGGAELSMLEVVKNMRGDDADASLRRRPLSHRAGSGRREGRRARRRRARQRAQGWHQAPGRRDARRRAEALRGTLAKSRDADVIYVNTQRAMVIGAIAGLISRRPVVWHLRDIVSEDHFGRTQLTIIKWCTKLMLEHVIANSTASATAVTALHAAARRAARRRVQRHFRRPVHGSRSGCAALSCVTVSGCRATRFSSARSAGSRDGRGSTSCSRRCANVRRCTRCSSARRSSARTRTRPNCARSWPSTGSRTGCTSSAFSTTSRRA